MTAGRETVNEATPEAVMINRSLNWMLIALGLSAFHPSGASAQGEPCAPLAAGVTACKFVALVKDTEPGGAAIRDVPQQDGREVARLPATNGKDKPGHDQGVALPEIQVIGFKDGWFLIEGAAYPEPYPSQPYTGRGWVEGKFVTTHLFRDTLKTSPSNDSPDVSQLYGTGSDGLPYRSYGLEVQRVLGCSGPWLEVEIHQPDAKTLSGKPAAAADGTVRGWTDRFCTKQDDGPCTAAQFDYPWSPLPSGVTECRFRALSNDPDPAGLNVRDAPDPNARILGRLLPRHVGGEIVQAEIQVIGYRKGWFLIEATPYHDADQPKSYSGRGWVAGSLLTAGLLRNRLKQAPSEQSADVIDLRVLDKEGTPLTDPQHVKMRRIIAYSGDWVQVEVALVKGMKPLLESGAPKGAVQGWANGTCAEQFAVCPYPDTPWSPPAPLPPE
jgi:hypothetical protein